MPGHSRPAVAMEAWQSAGSAEMGPLLSVAMGHCARMLSKVGRLMQPWPASKSSDSQGPCGAPLPHRTSVPMQVSTSIKPLSGSVVEALSRLETIIPV